MWRPSIGSMRKALARAKTSINFCQMIHLYFAPRGDCLISFLGNFFPDCETICTLSGISSNFITYAFPPATWNLSSISTISTKRFAVHLNAELCSIFAWNRNRFVYAIFVREQAGQIYDAVTITPYPVHWRWCGVCVIMKLRIFRNSLTLTMCAPEHIVTIMK